jgi:arginine decarboxylase
VGVFLVGAYQEILGDLHNLFGDTNAVHVRLNEEGEVMLDTVISGDTVREVLKYVNFDADALVKQLRTDVERAVRQGRFSDEEAGRFMRFYEDGLRDYTYLSTEASPLMTNGKPMNGNGAREEARAERVGG